MKLIEASMLAFNMEENEFNKTIQRLKDSNINNIHYDVMDGKFVPNTAFNGEKLEYLKQKGFTISVHLMVENVKEYVDFYLKFNIDYLTFHCEAIDINQSIQLLNLIKSKNIKAGIAIKPDTNPYDYKELLEQSDIVTIMGVQPGFGGQKYIESTTEKIKLIKSLANKNTIMQLDGGVNTDVIKLVKENVDFFVSGSFLINYQSDLKEITNLLK